MPMRKTEKNGTAKVLKAPGDKNYKDGIIKFIRESENARKPERKNPGDVGYDLVLSRDLIIEPNGFTDAHTDLQIKLHPGFWALITGRSSSIRKHGVLVVNGIIDNGYTGPLHIAVQNLRNESFFLEAGARIAQLLVLRIYDMEWIETNELPNTVRGDRGFGSTGN